MSDFVKCCSRCRAPLGRDVGGGVCTACLLEEALPAAEGFAEPVADHTLGADTALVQRFGDYELLEEIGRGGMGVIYKARQPGLDRLVALKMLLAGEFADAKARERLLREAKIAARLSHPHIVAIHEVGEQDGRPFFVMEYVAGRNLAQHCRDGLLPVATAVRYVEQLARAVHYAHQHGVIHRDLKPANVMIGPDDEPKLTDFGLTKSLVEPTRTIESAGSPNFMAPEQADPTLGGTGTLTDVFGLGAILYYLLTGRPPAVGETLAETLRAVVTCEPISPRQLRPALPRELETIALKCLEKEPSRRYGSALEVAEELARWRNHEPIRARPVNTVERLSKWVRRRPVVAGLAVTCLALLLMGVSGIAWQWRRAETLRAASRLDAYISAMEVVQQIHQSDPQRAMGILNRYRPTAGETDLRDWEWRYMWDQCRPSKPEANWRGEKDTLSMDLSADGRWIAVGELAGRARVFDAKTLRMVYESPGGGNQDSAQFMPSGNKLGAQVAFIPGTGLLAYSETRGISNCVIHFWDGEAGKVVRSLAQPYIVRNMEVTPDGRRLIVSYEPLDGRTIVWDLASGKMIASVPIGPAFSNYSIGHVLAVSPNGRWMTVDEFPNIVRVLEVETGREARRFPLRDQFCLACAFSPDNSSLAVCAGFSHVEPEIWNLETGHKQGTLGPCSEWISRLRFTPDGQRLAASGSGQFVYMWDLARSNLVAEIDTFIAPVYDFVISGEGKVFAGAKGVSRWDPASPPRPKGPITIPVGRFWKFMPDSRQILGVTTNNTVALFGGNSWDRVDEFKNGSTNAFAVELLPGGAGYLVGGLDGSLLARRWNDHGVIRVFEPLAGRPFHLQVDPSSGTAIAMDLAQVKVWDLATGRTRVTLREPLKGDETPNILPKSGRWSTLAYDGELLNLNLVDGAVSRRRLPFAQAEALNYSRSGKWAATCGANAPIRLYRGWDWSFVRAFGDDSGGSFFISFTPDEKRVVYSGSGGRQLEMWDVTTGRRVCVLTNNLDLGREVRFSPDGNILAQSGSYGYASVLWRAPSWDEIRQAEQAGGF